MTERGFESNSENFEARNEAIREILLSIDQLPDSAVETIRMLVRAEVMIVAGDSNA